MATDTEVQNADPDSESCPFDTWFRFTEGKLVPTVPPDWADEGLCPGNLDMEKLGFETRPAPEGDLLTFSLHAKFDRPHWVAEFCENGGIFYNVEIIGFPDWLEFCRYIAPMLAADATKSMESLAFRTVKRVLPGR